MVYRVSSGETHFLDPVSAAVLVALCREPDGDRTRLLDALRGVVPDADAAKEERLTAWIDGLLTRLVNAGLARPPDGGDTGSRGAGASP